MAFGDAYVVVVLVALAVRGWGGDDNVCPTCSYLAIPKAEAYMNI